MDESLKNEDKKRRRRRKGRDGGRVDRWKIGGKEGRKYIGLHRRTKDK